MRRVLIITKAFPPSTSAGIHRIVRFVRYLPDQGWTPIVLSEGTDDGLSMEHQQSLELPEDLPVYRTRAWGRRYDQQPDQHSENSDVQDRNGAASQADCVANGSPPRPTSGPLRDAARNFRDLLLTTPDRDIAWTAATVNRAISLTRRHRADLVLTSGPPHSTHLIGLSVKRVTGTPWVADFRDPWSRRPWGAKKQNPWGQRLLCPLERTCVRQATRILLNTRRLAEEFRDYYTTTDPQHFVDLPNGCDPWLITQIEELCKQRQQPASNGSAAITLCHPGSLYRKRDPRPILDAMAILRDKGTQLRFEQIGACDPSFQLHQRVTELKMEGSVAVHPPMPHQQCLERMAQADLFLLLQPGTATQVPGKLFEMLAFKKPIVAVTDEGETADLIADYGIGTVAAAEDPQRIADAITEAVTRVTAPRWNDITVDFDARRQVARLAEILDTSIPTPHN